MTSITRRNSSPFSLFFEDDFFGPLLETSYRPKRSVNRNYANIVKTDRGFTIEMIAPGFSTSDFNISAENGTLTINGESDNVEKNYSTLEYNISTFERKFNLPEGVNIDNINADYDAGILYINIPVVNENNIKKIIEIG